MELEIFIKNFIEQYGAISIFILLFLEYANFPLPSEVILPAMGILVASGSLNMSTAILISLFAGLLGSIINYYLGYYLGEPILNKLLKINPKFQKSIDSSMWWINKYGALSVMLSRVVPIARTFISIPAGVIKMKRLKFIMYSSAGIMVWNVALIYLGYICCNNAELISIILNRYSLLAVLLVLVVTSIIFIFTISSKNKNK